MIKVKNLNKRYKLNERFLKKVSADIIKMLKKPDAELEIVFLSDVAIRPFNKKYKHSDRATDVLSFDLDGLGEILISSDMALKNSSIFGTSFEEELVLYVIHGILHLCGYGDKTPAKKKEMRRREDFCLELLK